MSNIPDDIRDKIEQRFPDNNANNILGNNVKQMRQCAYIGYSLSLSRIEELEKENERLKGLVEKAWWVHSYGSTKFSNTSQYDAAWHKFKTEHNL